MPWLALPFGDPNVDLLNAKYEIQGIPCLVVLDSNGEIITKKGRQQVMSDPNANSYPWKPKTYQEIIPGPLIKSNKDSSQTIQYADLKGKTIGIYFSAHWCPPCRGFTPILADFYTKHKDSKNFEIIFSSRDKDEKSYQEYYGEMPWLSLPFQEQRNTDLANLFEFDGIPHLVFVDFDGNVVCSDATDRLRDDPEGKDFPWLIKPVYLFTDSIFERHINSGPSIFVKFPEDKVEENIAKLTEVVNNTPGDKKVHIFVYNEAIEKESNALPGLFQFAGADENNKPQILLLNVTEGNKHLSTENATFESVKKIVEDFATGTLEMSGF